MDTQTAARKYLARGWSVVPVGPNGPLVRWAKYQTALPTADEVREWWHRWPAANVSIATGALSGVVVVDLDRGHSDGVDGAASIRRAGLDLPETRSVRTPRGGIHAYYRHPGGRLPCVTDLLPGVDLKGDGGLAMAPPSSRPDGAYAGIPETRGLPLADLPGWVLERATGRRAPAGVTTDPDGWADLWAGAPEGQRNATCARLAGHLAAHGIGQAEAMALLAMWADRCAPPLTLDEVATTVASVYRTDRRQAPALVPMNETDAVAAVDRLPADLRRALLVGEDNRRKGALVRAMRAGLPAGAAVAVAAHWGLPLADAASVATWAGRAAAQPQRRVAR